VSSGRFDALAFTQAKVSTYTKSTTIQLFSLSSDGAAQQATINLNLPWLPFFLEPSSQLTPF
jgi:hypothetical protein